MFTRINRFLYIPLIFSFGLVFSACSPTVQEEDDFSDNLELLLRTALSDIQDNYIHDVDITELGINGLDYLTGKFDKLTLIKKGNRLIYKLNDEIISATKIPDDKNDVALLAFYLAQFLEDARSGSPILSRVNQEKFIEYFFAGLLEPLDRYSRYAGPRQALNERGDREGFGGVGIKLSRHRLGARIEHLNPGDPADAAGLHKDDILIAINGVEITGKPVDVIADMLRGPENKSVMVSILRDGIASPLRMKIGRDRIVPNTVFYSLDNGYPVIRITNFNKRTAKRMAEAVSLANQQGNIRQTGLMIDLRNNTGGLLNQAVDTADLFLNSGIISQINGRNPASDQLFFAENGDISAGAHIILMINGATASAAEILAAALQDNNRALVIGSNSFGKGSVQKLLTLPNGGELILTWAHFQSPMAYPLNEYGVMPTLCTPSGKHMAPVNKIDLPMLATDRFDQYRQSKIYLKDLAPSVSDYRRLCRWQGDENNDADIKWAKILLSNPEIYKRYLTKKLFE